MSKADVTLDPERQVQAKEYARIRRRLMLVELFLGGLYAFSWLVFGWSSSLKDSLLTVTSSELILVAVFAFVFGGC